MLLYDLIQEIGHSLALFALLGETRKQEGDAILGFHEDGGTNQLSHSFLTHTQHEGGITLLGHFRQMGQHIVLGIAPLVKQGPTVVAEQGYHMIGNHRFDQLKIVALRLGQIAFCVLVVIGANGIILLVQVKQYIPMIFNTFSTFSKGIAFV